jgi:hypothetical protein
MVTKNGGNINSASSSKNEQPAFGTKPVRKWAVSPPGEDTTCWGSTVSDKGEEMTIYKLSYELCRFFITITPHLPISLLITSTGHAVQARILQT